MKVKLFSLQSVLILSSFFLSHSLYAQGTFPEIRESSISIEDRTYQGYAASFDFPVKDVKKGLWKYCKGFGQLVNMRNYFEIIVPASENEGNIDVKLYSDVTGDETRALVKFAVDTAGLEMADISRLHNQSKTLLQEFRISYYNSDLQGKIDTATRQASKLSKKYKKLAEDGSAREKQEILEEITRLERRIEEWREQQLWNAQ